MHTHTPERQLRTMTERQFLDRLEQIQSDPPRGSQMRALEEVVDLAYFTDVTDKPTRRAEKATVLSNPALREPLMRCLEHVMGAAVQSYEEPTPDHQDAMDKAEELLALLGEARGSRPRLHYADDDAGHALSHGHEPDTRQTTLEFEPRRDDPMKKL